MIAEVNVAETKLTKPAWYQTTLPSMRSRIWADRCGKSSILFVPYFALWAAMVLYGSNGIALLDYPNARRGGWQRSGSDFYLFPRLLPWILLCVAPGKRHLRLHHGYSDLYSV